MKIETDSIDLQKLIDILKYFPNLQQFGKVKNIQITDSGLLLFDIHFFENGFAKRIHKEIKLNISSPSPSVLMIDMKNLKLLNQLLAIFKLDIPAQIAKKEPGILIRETNTAISLNIERICREKLELPLTVNILSLTLRTQKLNFEIKLST